MSDTEAISTATTEPFFERMEMAEGGEEEEGGQIAQPAPNTTIPYAPHKRFHIPGYLTAAMLVSIGGILNGFDTGSIGSITEMPYFQASFGVLSPALRGFAVSLIMLTGALPSVVAGQLADRYGRLRIVMVGALFFVCGSVLQAIGKGGLGVFLTGRALNGLGEGLWLSNTNVYITEIAPSARRGRLASLPQLGAVAGICAGYFTCYGTIRIASTWSWRLPFVIQAVLAVLLSASCLILPESPRWLVLHERRDEAIRELARLDFNKEEAEKDVLGPWERGQLSTVSLKGLLVVFQKQYRSRTILALFVLGVVQLSGIDGVLYYAPTLFAQAGIPSQTASFLASGISAILMFVVTIPALLLADRYGRRTSTLTGGVILSMSMLLIGILYASNSVHSHGVARWVVVVCIYVFGLTYSATWAVVAKIYASEIQYSHTRAAGNSLAQGLNFFNNFLVAILTPIFLSASAYGAYFLFGSICLFSVLVLAATMPETRGRSLETIQEAFRRPPLKSWTQNLGADVSIFRRRAVRT